MGKSQISFVEKPLFNFFLPNINRMSDTVQLYSPPSEAHQERHPAVAIGLREIASWDLEGLTGALQSSGIRASVPTLQRGLIWTPQQVEMLWDSILRGFPIGCLVVCDPSTEQENSGRKDINRHLLDGQQRCNAIALGYHDPFAIEPGILRGNRSRNILWLDLATGTKFPAGSTRQFLTRVTTAAHPWGYRTDDKAGRLEHSKIVSILRSHCPESLEQERPKRPLTTELYPVEAEAPIPMSWLLLEIMDGGNLRSPKEFWNAVESRLNAATSKWAKAANAFLAKPTSEDRKNWLYLALCVAERTEVVALSAPKNLIAESTGETDSHGDDAPDGISNIEHLFHRLNSQGTTLQGEELAYSMIKAYWPEIAGVVGRMEKPRVPEARLVLLGVRAALTAADSLHLRRSVSVSALRRIARDRDCEDYKKLASFFLSSGDRFYNAAMRVEVWLAAGLPAVLVSSIARGSQDVYLLLLVLADQCQTGISEENEEWVDQLPGLATLLHWFCAGNNQIKVADLIFNECRATISTAGFRAALSAAVNASLLPVIPNPDQIAEFLKIEPHKPEHWHFWIEHPEPEIQQERAKQWWPVLPTIVSQKEMLLYAQRDYLNRTFPDYDPADKNLWAEHNRPWDFDHLHAHAYFYYNQGKLRSFCRSWGNSIGNFRAWPFELNRSDQTRTLNDKIGDHPDFARDSFVDLKDVNEFSHGGGAAVHEELAVRFSTAVQARIVKIYRCWWDQSNINNLIEEESIN